MAEEIRNIQVKKIEKGSRTRAPWNASSVGIPAEFGGRGCRGRRAFGQNGGRRRKRRSARRTRVRSVIVRPHALHEIGDRFFQNLEERLWIKPDPESPGDEGHQRHDLAEVE